MAEASTYESKTAGGSGTDALVAGPSGSGWPGHSHLAAMLNSALVRTLRCLWLNRLSVEGIPTDSASNAQLVNPVLNCQRSLYLNSLTNGADGPPA